MKLRPFLRMYVLGFFIVVGSVMSFGLVATLALGLDKIKALSMLGMVPLMTGVMVGGLHYLMKDITKKQQKLLDAIHQVSEGDLTVKIPEKGAEEYAPVYREFNMMVNELAKTRQEMEDFSNTFAHEFRTPIASIQGFAKYLSDAGDEVSEEERKEYLNVMEEQSGRLLNLCNNTLFLSKLDAMEIVTDKENYDLAEQIRRTVIALLPQSEAKHIDITIPEDLVLDCRGNRELLEHVWINLLNNALKFTPEKETIEINGTCTDDSVNVSITDNGSGMDEETQAHLFERYYQGTAGKYAGGNGIGLSIVHRIVTLHNGRINVTSTPGQGSTFTVTLPRS